VDVSVSRASTLIVAPMTDTITPSDHIEDRADATSVELGDELLEGFRARAGGLDRTNTYFYEDLAELRLLGYLAAAVPTALGGAGYDLATLAHSQRRLARYAPATALATTMHHYWVGMAAQLHAWGDTSSDWMLHAALAGDVFAAGHAESGNDMPVLLSPDGPRVVHAFVERTSPGVTVVENWDTLGMRPTQSHDTVLDGVFVPDARIGRVVVAGDATDPFLVAMNIWALTLISNVYLGIAERAFEIAVAGTHRKTSIAIERGSMAFNPMVQHQVAEMYLELDAARCTVDRFATDWLEGAEHGPFWAAKVASMKWRAAEASKRIVDIALDIAGGGGMSRVSELERLYRDARCGGFHPFNDALTHELVGKTALGIDPGGPRW
jgi:alkylation response protein AidB-like acyl-CoA dehydrogenase